MTEQRSAFAIFVSDRRDHMHEPSSPRRIRGVERRLHHHQARTPCGDEPPGRICDRLTFLRRDDRHSVRSAGGSLSIHADITSSQSNPSGKNVRMRMALSI